MLTIKTWRDPYDVGTSLTRPREITFEPGLTVIVGCNGSGKSTLLHNINDNARSNKIPCHMFDNLNDGGHNAVSSIFAGFNDTPYDCMDLGIALWNASEGEAIKLNIARQSSLYKSFLKSGYYEDNQYRMRRAFSDVEEEPVTDNRRVLLFDAIDSGMSVDAVAEVRALFELLLNDAKEMGVELYLIASANEYELARGTNCFDVNAGKYIVISDYEEYRAFILKSRVLKEKRLDKEIQTAKKREEKAILAKQKREEKYRPKIEAIQKQALDANRELTWNEKRKIDNYERIIIQKDNG